MCNENALTFTGVSTENSHLMVDLLLRTLFIMTKSLIGQSAYRSNSTLVTEIIFHNVKAILITCYYKLSDLISNIWISLY